MQSGAERFQDDTFVRPHEMVKPRHRPLVGIWGQAEPSMKLLAQRGVYFNESRVL